MNIKTLLLTALLGYFSININAQLFYENFDPTDYSLWANLIGGAEASSCGTYATQNAYYFDSSSYRYAETIDLDLTNVDSVSFELFISDNYSYGCDYAETGENVYLYYSTNSGSTWNLLSTYYSGYNYYDYFTFISEALPSAAQTNSTRLLWEQSSFSGSGYDVWGLDEVTLIQNCTPSITPKITVNGYSTLCNGDSVKLTSKTAYSYLWSTGETTKSIWVKDAGTYSVTITDANNCAASTSTQIEVLGTVSAKAEYDSVCAGGNVQLSASSGTIFEDDFDPMNTSLWDYTYGVSATSLSCGNPDGDALYFYNGYGRYAETIALDVSSGGTIEFDLFIDYSGYCEFVDAGENVYLQYSTDGYYWYTIQTYYAGYSTYDNFTAVSTNIPTAAQTSSTQFRWYHYGSGSSYDYVGIDNVKIYSGSTSSSSSSVAYSWSPTTGLSDPYIANPVATINSNTTYTVTAYDATSGCSATNTVDVITFNTPTNLLSKTQVDICSGDDDTLSVIATNYENISWSNGDSSEYTYVSTSGMVTVDVTFNGGCVVQDQATVSVLTPITASITPGGSTTICNGSSVTLSSASSNSYYWSTGSTAQSITVSDAGNYSVQITDNYGCTSSDTINVSDGTPHVYISADSTTVCEGESFQLEAVTGILFEEDFDPMNSSLWDYTTGTYTTAFSCGNPDGDALYFYYSYYRYAETVALDVSSGGTIEFDLFIDYSGDCETVDLGEDVYLQYSTDGYYWYTIQTYYAGYSTYDNFTSVSTNIPTAAQTSATQFRWYHYGSCTSCDYVGIDNIKIHSATGSSTSNYDYSWSPSTGLSNSAIANPTATLTSSGTYVVTVTDPSTNCYATEMISIDVEAAPTIGFNATVTGTSATVYFGNNSSNYTSVNWYFGDGDTSTSTSPSHTYAEAGVYEVIMDINSTCGLYSDTQYVTITYCPLSYSDGPDSLDHIDGITLNTINTMGNGFTSGISYVDYTGIYGTTLNPNQTYTITIYGSGSDYETFAVWIDYNLNGIWGDNGDELVGESKSSGGSASITFTVPSNTNNGNGVMRVMAQEDLSGSINPCNSYSYGETEDYAVTLNNPNVVYNVTTSTESIKVYPNPFDKELSIDVSELSLSIKDAYISLYSITGQLILNESITSSVHNIDVSDVQPGVYYIDLMNQGQRVNTIKVVKTY